MDTPTPQTSTPPPASGETPEQITPFVPVPWSARESALSRNGDLMFIEGAHARVAEVWNGANAAYIVEACNAYPELKAQLTRLTQTLDQDRQTIASLRSVVRAVERIRVYDAGGAAYWTCPSCCADLDARGGHVVGCELQKVLGGQS